MWWKIAGIVVVAGMLGAGLSCGRSETEAELGMFSDPREPPPVECEVDADCAGWGDWCVLGVACGHGRCERGTPRACDDGIDCTDDVCDSGGSACRFLPDSTRCPGGGVCVEGEGCTDTRACETDEACRNGSYCDGEERCVDGLCRRGVAVSCDDGVDCTADSCNEAADLCDHVASDLECADASWCNGDERCDPERGCVAGTTRMCDDVVACTVDICNEAADRCDHVPRDRDGDTYGDAACGGTDCDDRDGAVNPGAPEGCRDSRDNDCDALTDCADVADCSDDPICEEPCPPEVCTNGVDDDCDTLTDCDDAIDCGWHVTCCVASPEVCTNDVDDDCDTWTDCDDVAACAGHPACCVPWPEDCTNGADDDCDTWTDCDDVAACAGHPACCVPRPEDCTNGADDDCDGRTDCADTGNCADHPSCCVPRVESCTNGVDDDCDTWTDCGDSDCFFNPACCIPSPETCSNLRDDDCDTLYDCADPDCAPDPACCLPAPEVCANGVDDDCDTLTDCGDPICDLDPSCCVPSLEACTNGVDDDCDTRADCADPDCASDPACCIPRPEECTNGVDDNCDTRADCADIDCVDHPACCVPAVETCNASDDDCDTVPDDGLTCYVSDGTAVDAIVTSECGAEFYQYGSPNRSSANTSPDITVSGKVVVAVHEGPEGCGGTTIAVIADRARDGSGGQLRLWWTSTPPGVTGVVVSDDPSECSYSSALGVGRCNWRWRGCCTDGVLIGEYAVDFCVVLSFTGASGVDEVRVLDGLGGYVSRGVGENISICRVTTPAV